jgi:hypothetical protein
LETVGLLGLITGGSLSVIGFLGDGAIDLTAASTEPEAAVSGSVTGHLLQFACANL